MDLEIRLTGASHDAFVGAVMHGLPSGIKIDFPLIERMICRRAADFFPWASARRESDIAEITGGITGGLTDGNPLEIKIYNRDVRRGDYDNKRFPRPSHADYPAIVKYGDNTDISGGGRFSGRMTAPLVFCGGLLRGWLREQGIRIYARVLSVGNIEDIALNPISPDEIALSVIAGKHFPTLSDERGAEMTAEILRTAGSGDSLGGVAQCVVLGLPVGSGGEFTDGLESVIAREVFAVPGVRALEFGAGCGMSKRRGSETNDALFYDSQGLIKTLSNHSGGVNGGLANGMPLIFSVSFRPTPSIVLPQRTVDLQTHENVTTVIGGRHDPCIVPRAVPVLEAVTAIALSRVF